jgi:hypothetical protein
MYRESVWNAAYMMVPQNKEYVDSILDSKPFVSSKQYLAYCNGVADANKVHNACLENKYCFTLIDVLLNNNNEDYLAGVADYFQV